MQQTNENLNSALQLYENHYSHEDLISMLKSGSDVQKQISALRLEKITSTDDAHAFVSNLVGQDGKIREAVSFRLKDLMCPHFLPFADTFLQAIIDINGNVCRNVICAISMLKNEPRFTEYFCPRVICMTLHVISILKSPFNPSLNKGGKYQANKEIFKLYWCLETIYEFFEYIDPLEILKIVSETKNIKEYTIREKTARILTKETRGHELLKIRQELKNDTNYYVSRI
ncbi:MAG: hypothetical protein LBJ74_05770 [Heliobacteriaceae bacterium]|jgi:hypothetical protein|nr:hypothetical protein [Heliobacteriaceae bacterium]